jgi:hypothetical protein
LFLVVNLHFYSFSHNVANRLQKPSIGTYPDISAIPWHPSVNFPWVTTLNANSSKIKEEYLQLVEGKHSFSRIHSNVSEGGEWHTFYFYNQGRRDVANCDRYVYKG